jgi:hypothetical protein
VPRAYLFSPGCDPRSLVLQLGCKLIDLFFELGLLGLGMLRFSLRALNFSLGSREFLLPYMNSQSTSNNAEKYEGTYVPFIGDFDEFALLLLQGFIQFVFFREPPF